jgi:hypothetical protein
MERRVIGTARVVETQKTTKKSVEVAATARVVGG